jgi:DNA-cytosine methyltransferase
MNILSLFGGIECGYLALKRAGIPINSYYSSEVDKFAIRIANYNFPDIIQLGDIQQVSGKDLPPIDLVMGGSPCQGFSKSGKGKNFKDERGKLFWEYVRLLKEVSPQWFLLENVKMKKEWQDVISHYLGVEPILFNSSLVSAQNRERLYWTNIPFQGYPQSRRLVIKDILESTPNSSRYRLSTRYETEILSISTSPMERCFQIGEADIKGRDSIKRVYSPEGKAPTVTTMGGGHREPKVAIESSSWRKLTPKECERLQTLPDDFTRYSYISERDKIVEISNSQRYKCVGNGWTVDAIVQFLKGIRSRKEKYVIKEENSCSCTTF